MVDKKFEGYSNLKGKAVQADRKAMKAGKSGDKQAMETEYIEILQKQVGTMESQIKLLKDREVDQKNKASGYETFLRDQIPLNEHFISLKNKFNNEKDALTKQLELKEEEIQHQADRNDQKKRQIENLKRDNETITQRIETYRLQADKKGKE